MFPVIILLMSELASGCIRIGGGGGPADGIDWQTLGKQYNLPGHIGYDPSSQTCCKGNVFDDTSIKCCGTTTYNPLTHGCCNGAPVKIESGLKTCCGQTLYNPADKKLRCCAGKVHELKDSEVNHVACCGQSLYRPGSQICCGDDSKGKGTILPMTKGKNMSCCDTKAYDLDTEVCCLEYSKSGPEVWESNIIPLEGNKRACCGGIGFDVTTHMCCVDVPIERHLTCCGAIGYDPNTEACCVLPPPESSKYPGVSKIPKPDEDTDCCNGKPYKGSTQSCCNYKIEDTMQCPTEDDESNNVASTTPKAECNGNTDSELCCGGFKVPKKGTNDVCCYDAQTDEPLFPQWQLPVIYG